MRPRQAATHELTYRLNELHREVAEDKRRRQKAEAQRELAARVRGNRGGGKLVSIIVFVLLLLGAVIVSWR